MSDGQRALRAPLGVSTSTILPPVRFANRRAAGHGAEPEVPKRGNLYWAHVDKRRPVLVISIDARNERASDLIVIPCSTNMREAPTHVRLRRGEGGVSESCMLKCEQITTLPNSDLDVAPLGGPLSSARLAEVERAVLRAIGIPV